jgi:molybdopterin synthase catalytic subunit
MSVRVEIREGRLDRSEAGTWPVADGEGAVLRFEGVVRGTEEGRAIRGLEYEAYRPMADTVLAELGERARARFGVTRVLVEHSVGFVPVGGCSFRLRVAGAHRAGCLEAMGWFIDEMKRAAPIWKRAVSIDAREEAAS